MKVVSNMGAILQSIRISPLILICVFIFSCSPKTSSEYCKSGFRYLKKYEKKDQAFQSFSKALELDSSNYNAYYGFGWYYQLHFDSVSLDLSRKNLLKAVSLNPLLPEAYFLIAYTYVLQSKKSAYEINGDYLLKALPFLDKAISLDSNNSMYYYERFYCKIYVGDSIDARNDLIKSCEYGNFIACWMLEIEANRKH